MKNSYRGIQPHSPSPHRTYTLASDISAMQILPFDEAGIRLGPVSKLPRGAKIQTCGGGFDPKTLKVAYGGQFFYVFLQDLGLAEQPSPLAMFA